MGSEAITEKPGETAGAAAGSENGIVSGAPPETVEGGVVPAPGEVKDEPTVAVKPPEYKGFDRVLTFLLLLLVFLLGSFPVINSDILMNLATGRSIAGGEYQFGVDPYSFATQANADQPATTWVNHSWFYSLMLYFLFNLLGESGLVVMHALFGVALASVLLRTRDRRTPLLIGVFFTGLAFLALSPRFFLWPTAVSMVLFAIMLHLLYRAGVFGGIEPERVNPRLLWGVPLLTVLWVNLDAWFVLAPLTLGLVWAGMEINQLLGSENKVKGKELGLIFAATFGAGLLNPHLFQAYMLPPELAYLLVHLGLPAPEFVAAGGYTLDELHRQQPLTFLFSPLNGFFFSSPVLGGNVAGWSFFALFLVGFMAFLSQFLAVGHEGEAGIQGTRILPWLFFGGIALLESSLVPWFAVFSGVVGMINMGDWLRQRETRTTYTVGDAGPARLARLCTLLLLVVALVMVWPGWLHSKPGEFDSTRRVGWRFALDPAQAALAQQLDQLHKAGEARHVFNFHRDTANYIAWHAPGVRTFLDSRHSLFPKAAKLQGEWKQALWDEANLFFGKGQVDWERPPATTWRDAFRKWDIGHIAVKPVADRDGKNQALIREFWLRPQRWTLQFADGSLALFAWGGLDERKPGADYVEQRTREVFTEVPAQRRPPSDGFMPPLSPDTWDLYAKGKSPPSDAPLEFGLWLEYYRLATLRSQRASLVGIAIACGPAEGNPLTATLGSVLCDKAWPEFMAFPWISSGRTVLGASDAGPPAIPIFLVQDARRNLAKMPFEMLAYQQVIASYQLLANEQEDFWSNFDGGRNTVIQREWQEILASLLQPMPPEKAKNKDKEKEKVGGPAKKAEKEMPKTESLDQWRQASFLLNTKVLPQINEGRRLLEFRDNLLTGGKLQAPYPSLRLQLRQMQLMAYQKMAADVHPDNYDAQRNLAIEYRKHYFLDAALEQWQKALAVLEVKADPKMLKEKEGQEKYVGNLEKAVKERREQFERIAQAILEPARKDGDPTPNWERLYDVALILPYSKFGKEDKRQVDAQGRGLPLALLAAHKELAKDVPGEQVEAFIYLQLDLKLRLGQAAEVAEILRQEPLDKFEGWQISRLRALTAGVLGDYAAFEKHAEKMQSYLTLGPIEKQIAFAESIGAASALSFLPGSPPVFGWIPHEQTKIVAQNQQFRVIIMRVDFLLVRGLMALEAGDGVRARKLFEETLAAAGPFALHSFLHNELNIPRRYLAWMRKE